MYLRSVFVGCSALLAALVTVPPQMTAARAGSPPNAPINHIVVLMQENRSYDSYFGQLHFEGQAMSIPEPMKGNPNPVSQTGRPIQPFHKANYCEAADLNHSWTGAHREWDNGAMNGFTLENADPADTTGSRTMGYYDDSDLPFYYALGNTFGVGDRYFSSVLGPTFPNRFYLLAGTSFGHISNDFPPPGGFTQPTVFRSMTNAGVSWKVYYSQAPFAALFSDVQQHPENLAPISQFFADARSGHLPQVSLVDPIFVAGVNTETDEHPPSNIQVGEAFSASVVDSLLHSPNWHDSAMFLTYDENGGFYDHVSPPAAVAPDDISPPAGSGPWTFDRYGFRVPLTVISPYVIAHGVSHDVYDHTSILRFIELRYGLQALTNRDAAANPLLGFFDFSHPDLLSPPALPAAPIDAAHAAQCAAG